MVDGRSSGKGKKGTNLRRLTHLLGAERRRLPMGGKREVPKNRNDRGKNNRFTTPLRKEEPAPRALLNQIGKPFQSGEMGGK